jgi:hypothetical protein
VCNHQTLTCNVFPEEGECHPLACPSGLPHGTPFQCGVAGCLCCRAEAPASSPIAAAGDTWYDDYAWLLCNVLNQCGFAGSPACTAGNATCMGLNCCSVLGA